MVDLKILGDPNGYEQEVKTLLTREFPQIITPGKEEMLAAVIGEFIGSRQIRWGSGPNPESLVAMRKVALSYIEQGLPIPVLVPSGPKKPGKDSGIDIAELAAMRTLGCLDKRVRQHYSPGLHFSVRLEDATCLVLEGNEMMPSCELYMGQLESLVRILGFNHFITLKKETAIVDAKTFVAASAGLKPFFLDFLKSENPETSSAYSQLKERGWQGLIPEEMQSFLYTRYDNFHPGITQEDKISLAASYLACALARRRLKASGANPEWANGHLEVSFAPPMPGTPPSLTSTRVFYRQVPLKDSKMHIPFWRAKGVIKIGGKKGTRMALCHWGTETDFSNQFELSNGNETIIVQADHIVE